MKNKLKIIYISIIFFLILNCSIFYFLFNNSNNFDFYEYSNNYLNDYFIISKSDNSCFNLNILKKTNKSEYKGLLKIIGKDINYKLTDSGDNSITSQFYGKKVKGNSFMYFEQYYGDIKQNSCGIIFLPKNPINQNDYNYFINKFGKATDDFFPIYCKKGECSDSEYYGFYYTNAQYVSFKSNDLSELK